MISLMLTNVFITNIRLFRTGADRVVMDEEARSIFQRVTSDLESLFIPHAPLTMPPFSGKNQIPVVTADGIGEADSIRFATINSPLPRAPGTSSIGEVRWIEYTLERTAGNPIGRLVRKLSPQPAIGGTAEKSLVLSTHVQHLNFRYLAQQQWSEEWDHSVVPEGVEIMLILHQKGWWRSITQQYRTFVRIPLHAQ
jgi:hypothetical protein